MRFILQVLRELTLPLLTDTEISSTGLDKTSPLRKVDAGITWIKELILFHISIYELNSRA